LTTLKDCDIINIRLVIKEMKTGEKITKAELEQEKGFVEKGYFADCIIFGKSSERVLWNPEAETIGFVYNL